MLVQREDYFVIRFDTNKYPVVIKSRPDATAIAQEVARNHKLTQAGLPISPIIGHGEEPTPHLVLKWIEGKPLSSSSPVQAQREAGELLRKAHSLGGQPPFFGNHTWDEWMRGWLNHALPWWQSHADIANERVAKVWQRFEELQPLLNTRGYDFMLYDGRPEHFLVKGNRIAGIIDVMEARAGDAAMDLGVFCVTDPDLLKEVLNGYQPTDKEQEIFAELVPFYTFLRRLAAVEWHHVYGDPAISRLALRLIEEYPFPA